jgi:hypothetical protein
MCFVLAILVTAVAGILMTAALNFPVSYATAISAMGIALGTAVIMQSRPTK